MYQAWVSCTTNPQFERIEGSAHIAVAESGGISLGNVVIDGNLIGALGIICKYFDGNVTFGLVLGAISELASSYFGIGTVNPLPTTPTTTFQTPASQRFDIVTKGHLQFALDNIARFHVFLLRSFVTGRYDGMPYLILLCRGDAKITVLLAHFTSPVIYEISLMYWWMPEEPPL